MRVQNQTKGELQIMKTWKSEYFCGNKISQYGLQNGYVDYRTMSRAFNHILNNNIINMGGMYEDWELVSGCDYDEENDYYLDIYQWYIVDDNGAEILKDFEEIVYYNEELDIYLWGVTHLGTSWDYVLTNMKIELDK